MKFKFIAFASVSLFMSLASPAFAAAPAVVLDESVVSVDSAPSVTQPQRAFISNRTLTATENDTEMDFSVALKMRHFSELQERIGRKERVSQAEMVAKYEPLAADYQAVVTWLTGQGFTITFQDPSHIAVFARGKVNQLKKAFKVDFAKVTSEKKEFTSAINAPSVPADLASVLVGINGLQPQHRLHPNIIARPNTLTSTSPPFTPQQIAKAYNADTLISAGYTGTNQTIAIINERILNTSDLTQFWTKYSIAQSLSRIATIQVGTVPTTTVATDEYGEECLDAEWSSSIAPNVNVRLYAWGKSSMDAAIARVLADATGSPGLNIHQMSISYGFITLLSKSQYTTDEQYYTSLANAGVTVFASSGDGGSTPSSGGETGTLLAEYPAADPNVVGVGGTSLTLSSSGTATLEKVWNDASGASGGGVGTLPRPAWQFRTGVIPGTTRLVPDVALVGDPDTGAELVVKGQNAVYGGTSWSSPTWAAFCAVFNQARSDGNSAGSIGGLGPYLYPLLGTSCFRDITVGNNATPASGGLYQATVGYDMCTGIGVPNVLNIANEITTGLNPPVVTGTAPNGTVFLSYNYTYPFTYTGAISPTFSVSLGSLPPGLSLSGSGTLSGTPTQAGEFTGDVFAANPGGGTTVPFDIVINQLTQTINFPAIPEQSVGATLSLDATSSSGLTVTYEVSGPATLTGSKLVFNGVGTVSVTALQTGDTNYAPAKGVTNTFQVVANSQTITFPTTFIQSSQDVVGETITLSATTSSGLPVTYTVTGPATLDGFTLNLTGPGIVTITASQAGNGTYAAAAPITTSFVVTAASTGAGTNTNTDVFSGVLLGGGYYYSAWFGIYNSQFYPWDYRTDLGFFYVEPVGNDLYLYLVNGNPAPMGWLYTTSAIFPNVYSFTHNSWLYYGGGTDFFNYTIGGWETY